LLFVDDIILIDDDVERTQKLIDIVEKWGKDWGMELSASKTKWMTNMKGIRLWLGEKELERVEHFKHLGVIRQEKKGWIKHEEHQWSKLSRRIWGIRKLLANKRNWGPMEGMRMWEVMIKSLIWWAVGGWEPSKTFMNKITIKKRALLKEWLGVVSTASNIGIEAEVGMWRGEDEVMSAKLGLWGRLKRSDSEIIKMLLPGSILNKWVIETKKASGLNTSWVDKIEWKEAVERAVCRLAIERWKKEKEGAVKMEMWKEMDSGWGLKWWIAKRPDGWRSMVKIRLEDDLMIEKGRYWPRIDRERRTCPLCDKEVEDTWHIMAVCNRLGEERFEFWENTIQKLNSWWNVIMIQRRHLGLSTLGIDSPLARILKEISPWNRIKMMLGGMGADAARAEEWEILFTEVAGFCKKIMNRRLEIVLEHSGGRTAARVTTR
jgi:hypothetical protein